MAAREVGGWDGIIAKLVVRVKGKGFVYIYVAICCFPRPASRGIVQHLWQGLGRQGIEAGWVDEMGSWEEGREGAPSLGASVLHGVLSLEDIAGLVSFGRLQCLRCLAGMSRTGCLRKSKPP